MLRTEIKGSKQCDPRHTQTPRGNICRDQDRGLAAPEFCGVETKTCKLKKMLPNS